jgi:acyl transferase domain-containing protein
VKRISINNFGFGGANGHAIIESVQSYLQSHYIPKIQRSTLACPATLRKDGISGVTSSPSVLSRKRSRNGSKSNTSRPFLLAFSSHDSSSLSHNISAVETVASQYHPADIARTLSLRSRLYHRAFTIASPSDNPIPFSSITTGKRFESPPRLIFVFTGQGAQYQLMGASLLSHSTFAATLRHLNTHLRSIPRPPSWDLTSALSSPETKIHDPAFSQTLCTALQIALTDLLSSFGVTPSATVGHSSGEIGAAYAAGILTREEAITIAYYRGLVVEKLHTDGAMLAVGLGVEEIRPYLEGLDGIRIACINSPQSVTLSGDRPAIESVHEQLLKDSVFSRTLRTGGRAYHSSHMKTVGTEYEIFLRHTIGRKRNTGKTKSGMKAVMVSSVYAKPVTGPVGVEYWRKNLESPVMFHQAVTRLHELGVGDKFLELGPHSALEGPLRQIRQFLGASAPGYLPTLIRNDDAFHSVLQACGKLFLEGVNINLTAVNAVSKVPRKLLVDLPSYQWNHDTVYWEENTLSASYRFRKHPRHDLLGTRIPYGGTGVVFWRNLLRLKDCPWIKDHQVRTHSIVLGFWKLIMIDPKTRPLSRRGVYFHGTRGRHANARAQHCHKSRYPSLHS